MSTKYMDIGYIEKKEKLKSINDIKRFTTCANIYLEMSLLFNCGLCCMLLSIWAVIQLVIMGIFFKMEVVAFIEEAEPDHHSYDDFEDFMKQTEKNYSLIAVNCWIGAAIYMFMIGVSYLCIIKARAKERAAAEHAQDDETFCKNLAKAKNS